MIVSRWFFLGPVMFVAWACSDTQGPESNSGGAGNATGGAATGGSANGGSTSGSSGAGAVGGSGGAGATTSGGSGGSGISGNAGSGVSGSAGTPSGGSGGSGPPTTCTFTVTKSLSERIPTVGIVEFSTDLAGMTDARIEFGRDTTYGTSAPVDLAATNYRTLLLGMKPSTMYHFRIVASGSSGQCTGPDEMIETGARANALPTIMVNTMNPAGLSGGFMITAQYQGSTGSNAPAYILDADGDYVWWHMPGGQQKTSAKMSYDGKWMWIQNANVPENQGATVHRVSMDGMTIEDHSDEFEGANHQFTVLPDETIIFYAYGSNSCDDIKERSPTGQVRTIVNSLTAQGLTQSDCSGMPCCHVNAVEYSEVDDTIVFSDLDHNSYTKVRRNGEVVWVLGGPGSDFMGMPAQWERQHGIDVLEANRFVFFNNGAANSGPSVAIEILLDLNAMTATRPWSYTPTGVMNTVVMGDVQRMPNGNTVVAYSTRGVVHEVNAMGQLVQTITWPSGGAIGYINKRPTLYGDPIR